MYTHTPALRNLLFDASAVTLKVIIDENTMFLSVPGSPPLPQSMTSEVVFLQQNHTVADTSGQEQPRLLFIKY